MHTKLLNKKLLSKATILAAPLILVGCSSVPDYANPVEWYRSSVEYFSEEDEEMVAEPAAQESSSTDVVEAPKPKIVENGFVAAKTPQREYAQPVMRQGDVVNALTDSKTVEVAEPPKPVAAPTTPVETAQMPKPVQAAPQTAPTTEKITLTPPSQPVAAPAPTVAQTQQLLPETDNRSVQEIYAANIAQTRPIAQTTSQMRAGDLSMLSGGGFGTVVVSSSGIDRQATSYAQPMQQVASLSPTFQQSTISQTNFATGAMMGEPSVVERGQAMSLRQYNPAMFSGTFQVATIQFGNGSAALTAEDRRILKEVMNIHRQQGGIVRVVGHASSRTRDMAPAKHKAVNYDVSLDRSNRVAVELIKMGIAPQSLFVGGVSDTQPLYQEVMPSGEAGNRRTEIFVDY